MVPVAGGQMPYPEGALCLSLTLSPHGRHLTHGVLHWRYSVVPGRLKPCASLCLGLDNEAEEEHLCRGYLVADAPLGVHPESPRRGAPWAAPQHPQAQRRQKRCFPGIQEVPPNIVHRILGDRPLEGARPSVPWPHGARVMASGGFRTQSKSYLRAESGPRWLRILIISWIPLYLPFHVKEERHLSHYLLLGLWWERKSQHCKAP